MYSNNAVSRVFNRKETIHCNNYNVKYYEHYRRYYWL